MCMQYFQGPCERSRAFCNTIYNIRTTHRRTDTETIEFVMRRDSVVDETMEEGEVGTRSFDSGSISKLLLSTFVKRQVPRHDLHLLLGSGRNRL